MLLISAVMPLNCMDCRLENLIEDCPCNLGLYSASQYQQERCPECPIGEVFVNEKEDK